MSKNRKRHKNQVNTNKNQEDNKGQEGWPSWFLSTDHPVEREVLLRTLNKNERLREVSFIVQMMRMNYMVFKRNYEELIQLLDKFDNPMNFRELALETDKGQEITRDTVLEFTRLLHNFLASVKMLVDVTRAWVVQQFDGSDFLNIYKEQINQRFTNNIQAQFLEDLRNFTLHRTLPLSILELRMHEVDEHMLKSSLGIVLIKEYLLDWDNWSELGRMQIDMMFEGEVDIKPIIEQYFTNVTEFTRWLAWQVRELFGKEVDEINSVILSIRRK